ncbi:hypothetical protein N7492_003867 [Penicillium capsulatum]|uniref:ER-bound oxygenase mpaB/mpaB'/Rubber oxygenase catalytic domain-containing protein n=1 Tax=Penicillium capsulatum TaxID=69766 RepID=A0A9W9IMV0_9EURO|nr:hypothetical protein N7492_003867 [Penicillium capsulatum]KAJ6121552.1 hypothetical protein N7512_004017 [Penicillium capsulatum]
MNNQTLFLAAEPISDAARSVVEKLPKHWLPYVVSLLIGYPLLTGSLRYRRLRKLHKQYDYPTRESMAKMTDEDAFEIQKAVAQLEFPFMFIKSLQFALFRTYGIPTISSLLTKTSQFSNPETSLKRYADTATLVQEMIGNSPTSQRAYVSLARTRFLHSGYRASGKILDDDMLYTLALFALEPIHFIDKYEWRTLSDLERCAIGTFWKSIGDGLGVSYDPLPSSTGFRDGIQWLEEIGAWSEAYEARCMVPDRLNRMVADQTTAMLVYMLPRVLHPVGLQFVSYMMDDRLRRAMLYEPPTAVCASIFSALLTTRKLALRYLIPPRPYFLRYASFTEEADENNRFFLTKWDAAPYYVKPTFWNRWGPTAWLTWVLGRPLPGDDDQKYYSSGYSIENVGPKHFEGKGKKSLEETMEEFKEYRTGKCPFH